MSFNQLFSSAAISGSGMSAERFRMELIANNIANANSTRSANGGPFRRQDAIFAEVLGDAMHSSKIPAMQGVRIAGVVDDQSELPRIFMPGHPDADAEGFVRMPNVQLPIEMVNMLTAARAYEANLKAAQTFRQISEQALSLIRV